MRIASYITAFLGLALLFSACQPPESGSDTGSEPVEALPPPPPPPVRLSLINTFAQKVELRVFDDGGYVVAQVVPARSQLTVEFEPGVYSLGLKDPISGEYFDFFPRPDLLPTEMPEDPRFALTVDEVGDTTVRFQFERLEIENSRGTFPGEYAFVTRGQRGGTFALADMAWAYGQAEDYDPFEKLAEQETAGRPMLMGIFAAGTPFLVPEGTSGPFAPMPDTITIVDGQRFVPKLFPVPDSLSPKEIENHIVGKVLMGTIQDKLKEIAE